MNHTPDPILTGEPASHFIGDEQDPEVFDADLTINPIYAPGETGSCASLIIEMGSDRKTTATIELTPAGALMLASALMLTVAPHLKEE
jgi:hypothetical protein